MPQRFVCVYYPYLQTDWLSRRNPAYKNRPVVISIPEHGRLIVQFLNVPARTQGLRKGMTVADARAIVRDLEIVSDVAPDASKLLHGLAEWFIRFSPCVTIDPPDGLILDATGCAHLWGDEEKYLLEMQSRMGSFGYETRIAISDTIGSAWGHSRFSGEIFIVLPRTQTTLMQQLPPEALRLQAPDCERLRKLGLSCIGDFSKLSRPALRKRFGADLLLRLDQASGKVEELINSIKLSEPYQEWLPAAEPITTRLGIEIALERMLQALCTRLAATENGLRRIIFSCHLVDRKIEQIHIGTNRPTSDFAHLFKLLQLKIESIDPGSGIELFTLDAQQIQKTTFSQEQLWGLRNEIFNHQIADLLDRISAKAENVRIERFFPDQHYWPERSFKISKSLEEKPECSWPADKQRPVQLLRIPKPIRVTAPVPDYPPMMFRLDAEVYKVARADGPERIEQEWWLQTGEHRDYYCVEIEDGRRFWIFRSGHYDTSRPVQWFLHGFFA